MRGHILIVEPARVDILYNPIQAGLLGRGHRVTRYPGINEFISDRAARANADVLIGLGVQVSRDLMASMPRLRAVMSPVTGTDGIDELAATELGIVVGNGQIPENTESLAEATVMLMLAALYDLRGSEMVLRESRSHPMPVTARMLKGKLIGLIGFGQIARAIVKRLSTWEVRFQTCTRRARSDLPREVSQVGLDELLHTSDIVTVLCPLTSETRGMLNAQRLASLKRGAIFVNTARGGIVDEAALAALVRSKHLQCIAVDVFATEPPPSDNPLRQLSDVEAILTPHMVGHTAESIERLPMATIESIERIMRGEPPLYVRNPQVIDAWRRRWNR